MKFLQEGLKYAGLNRKLFVARNQKSKDYEKYQKEFMEQVKAHVIQNPFIIGPADTGFYNTHSPRPLRSKANQAAEKYLIKNNMEHMIKR